MWNNNSSNPAEADEKAKVDNVGLEGTFEVAGMPSTAKRQRRPSVRLEEPWDHHANRTKMCSLLHDVDNHAHLKEDLCPSNAEPNIFSFVKSPSYQPGGSIKDGAKKASCYVSNPPEPRSDFKKMAIDNQIKQLPEINRKKGRGGRKLGVSKLATSSKKSPSMPQLGRSIRASKKTPHMKALRGMYSDKENKVQSLAVGLVASTYDHESSTPDESGQDSVLMLNSHPNHEVRDYLPLQVQATGGGIGHCAQTSSRRQPFEVVDSIDGNISAHATASLGGPRGKLILFRNGRSHSVQNRIVLEANADGNSMEPNKSHIHQSANNHSLPLVGVREWLQNLGLGKYTKLFEDHEVEPEVLPLLTFEDLREMGVFAVGSRRKIFSAIQQFRKSMLPEAS